MLSGVLYQEASSEQWRSYVCRHQFRYSSHSLPAFPAFPDLSLCIILAESTEPANTTLCVQIYCTLDTTYMCVGQPFLVLRFRGEGSVAGKGRLVDVPKFHSWSNKHSRFDAHCLLWPVCCINGASLSKTHTSVTALCTRKCTCMLACLHWPLTIIQMSTFKSFTKVEYHLGHRDFFFSPKRKGEGLGMRLHVACPSIV